MNMNEDMFEITEFKMKKLICKKCMDKYGEKYDVISYPFDKTGKKQIMFCTNEKDIHFQILNKEDIERITKELQKKD